MSERRGLPTDEDIQEGLRAFGRLMPSAKEFNASVQRICAIFAQVPQRMAAIESERRERERDLNQA